MTHNLRRYINAVQMKEPITEVTLTGDHPFQWEQRTEKRWDAVFAIGQRQIEIICSRISGSGTRSSWRVDFRRGNYPNERGSVKDTALILSTVTAAVREFVDTVQPQRLIMSPTGQSREKLYRAVLHRVMPAMGDAYTLEEKWYGTLFGEFELNRKPDR